MSEAESGQGPGGELDGVLAFLRAAERLKTVRRSGWTSEGERESVAEHTWRVCLMAMLVAREFPGIDFGRLIRMCIVHDLGEVNRRSIESHRFVVHGFTHNQETITRGPALLINPGEACGWLTGVCTAAILDLETGEVEILSL